MNWSAEPEEVPPAVVRVIAIWPGEDAGEETTQVVVELQVIVGAPTTPKLAAVAPVTKPVPLTVTLVAPVRGPALGVMPVTVGEVS